MSEPRSAAIQDKRDGLDLLTGMTDAATRAAIIRTFEGRLTAYVFELLDPGLDDQKVLCVRMKAIGIIEALDAMGVKISRVSEALPIRRATNDRVRESLGQDLADR